MAEPNKDYRKQEKAIDYDRKQGVLIPRKDELLDTIVDFIPFAPDDQLRILDVEVVWRHLFMAVVVAYRE
ncbi:MAG: hypothetical protein SRB2_00012 [Desulfobacteraceae bacterium Eth-SRB2]|nr:MAG: hypothetical protein SRB2_00012 [Desulfobacteraceae bacterium Eth-SRB2]